MRNQLFFPINDLIQQHKHIWKYIDLFSVVMFDQKQLTR
jgi:hypothetical protein